MTELTDQNPPAVKRRIVLLTGMSGAGLSTALKSFEDIGYEAVDNLRLNLVPMLVADKEVADRSLAVAIDTRNPNFNAEDMLRIREVIEDSGEADALLVFLECSDEALERRFTETRRRHPMALDRPVPDGIKREREMLWKLKNEADHVVDTSMLSIHELRRLIGNHYRPDDGAGLNIFVTSFSFRHGVPREADLVFDVRFLDNPHYDPELRPLSGLDKPVADYIRKDAGLKDFMHNLTQLLVPLLPRYQREGKSYLTIAIGCTGGRHRSVFIAEEITTILSAQGYIVGVGHRDLDRGRADAAAKR